MVSLSSRFETAPDFNASKHIKFDVRKVQTDIKSAGWVWQLTKCSRGIRNAWHFHYALALVIKVVAATSVLRCSPLNMALYNNRG